MILHRRMCPLCGSIRSKKAAAPYHGFHCKDCGYIFEGSTAPRGQGVRT